MIKSMTGYGKSECQLNNKKILVEIRSLNSKNFDVIFRIPNTYKEKEGYWRNFISQILIRGKIEVVITVEFKDEISDYSLNKALFKKYYEQLKGLSEDLKADKSIDSNLFSAILRLPDVLKPETEDITDEECAIIEENIRKALEITDNYRIAEGENMGKDLKEKISNISKLFDQIKPFEKQRIENIKQKISNSLNELAAEYDKERFEQELVYYLEKLDINEEKVRLKNHLEYFTETINNKEISKGKKLSFITQEIGREINTIGSKASDANIQRLVVQMKDELEKIKEQLFNVL